MNYGYSIHRVAKMHEIAAGGETKTRSEAHESDNRVRGSSCGIVPTYALLGLSDTA